MRRASTRGGAKRRLALGIACLWMAANAGAQDLMADGRKLFTAGAVPACAVCHTLKHAGAVGEIGPSLDELKPDEARVAKAVRNGIGQMPAFGALSDAQVNLVSRYVAQATGASK